MARYSQKRLDAMWRHLRIAGMCIGFGFLGWLFWRLIRDPQWLTDHLAIPGFIEAVAIGIVANAIIGLAFSELIAKTASDIVFSRRIAAFDHSQIAKYIPGRIAALLVQRSILTGPSATAATITSNIELMAVSSWLCTGAALALLLSNTSILGSAVIATGAITGGALLIAIDWNPLIHRVLRMIPAYRNSSLKMLSSNGRIGPWRSVALSTGILLLPAASSYVLLINGLNVDQPSAPLLTALLLLSWVGGVIAIVFPAGIGIREMLFFAMGSVVSNAPAPELMAGIALASRLVQILIDVGEQFSSLRCNEVTDSRESHMNSIQSHVPDDGGRRVQSSLRKGLWLLVEKILRWCINPRLRARLLGLFGANVGRNVRVYEIQLFNLEQGFKNLSLADDVHIGPGCRLDLAGSLAIGTRTTLSPGVTILTHADPGESHGSKLTGSYPACTAGVSVGADCWLGANATILCGIKINDLAVVAAGSIVTKEVPASHVVAGNPARSKKRIANDTLSAAAS